MAIDDHDVTGIQSGAQANAVAGSLSDSDGGDFRNGVLGSRVFGDGVDVRALRAPLNSSCGNDDEIALCTDEKMDIDKLIGEKSVVSITKDGLQLICTSRQINLIVDGQEFSAGDFGGIVPVVRIYDKLNARPKLCIHVGKLILWQAEYDRHRLQLGDDQESVGVRGVHDVTDINEAETDAAADPG